MEPRTRYSEEGKRRGEEIEEEKGEASHARSFTPRSERGSAVGRGRCPPPCRSPPSLVPSHGRGISPADYPLPPARPSSPPDHSARRTASVILLNIKRIFREHLAQRAWSVGRSVRGDRAGRGRNPDSRDIAAAAAAAESAFHQHRSLRFLRRLGEWGGSGGTGGDRGLEMVSYSLP